MSLWLGLHYHFSFVESAKMERKGILMSQKNFVKALSLISHTAENSKIKICSALETKGTYHILQQH